MKTVICENPRMREAALFLLASLAACAAVFGDALIGRHLLAPVDIAPALWPHYRFVDPGTNGIPANHHIVDQLGYDLPLQWTIYHAYRAGEIPWWDPYTNGGRPLLADAHVNAADPVRVPLYLAVPSFVLAYNWTLVLHVMIGGAGFFCLLRRFGAGPWIAMPLALAGQFAGANALYFGHPWVNATFAWYPWLWLAWHASWEVEARWAQIAAPLFAAAAVYAGNLQSHVYLGLFGAAFLIGYGWRRALPIVVWSGLLAALLAAPVLLPEVELFANNARTINTSMEAWHYGDGLLALAALHPWVLGTFRTLTYANHGFHVFIGGVALCLAFLGGRAKEAESAARRAARRCALALAGSFVIIMSTPLQRFLYARAAGLAVLGLVVLAAFGCARLPEVRRRWAWALGALAVAIAFGSELVTAVIYPRFGGRLAERLMAHAEDDGSHGRSRELRAFQVRNFSHEVGFVNPEVLASWLGLAALALVLSRARWRSSRPAVALLLVWNVVPLLWFTHRFIPRTPLDQWQRLRDGSATQREVAAALAGRNSRLREMAPGMFETLFPQTLAHLLRVHTVTAYAALIPRSVAWQADQQSPLVADFVFETKGPDDPGTLRHGPPDAASRFAWESGGVRPVGIVHETLNRIELTFPAGPAQRLLRTDTAYPGWSARTTDGRPAFLESPKDPWSTIAVPDGARGLVLEYRPTGWPLVWLGPALALSAAAVQTLLRRRAHLSSETARV